MTNGLRLHAAQSTLATTALTVSGYLAAQAPLLPVADSSVSPLIEYGIRQGGFVIVLFVVLFFYRRDWSKLSMSQEAVNAILLDLVKDNTKAQTDTANALAQNTVVVHQAKSVMQKYLPERRDIA